MHEPPLRLRPLTPRPRTSHDLRPRLALAAVDPELRATLIRGLTDRFLVIALDADPEGTQDAVANQHPDVLVCDRACGSRVVATPDRETQVVMLGGLGDAAGSGVTHLPVGVRQDELRTAVQHAADVARAGAHVAA